MIGDKTMKNGFKLKLIRGRFEDITAKSLDRPKLTILDPPYNIDQNYHDYQDKIPDEEYEKKLEQWIKIACDITDGPVFLIIGEKWIGSTEAIIQRNQIPLIRRIVWFYTFGQNQKKSYASCFTPIYWLNNPTIYPKEIYIPSARQEKYGDTRANENGKMPPNVWEYPRICGTFKERRKFCPNQLPEAMVQRIVVGHSKIGDLVLDPFLGSGTTALVCQALGDRKCIGIDMSQHYLDMIKKELKKRDS